jgi:hypothetical protein
MIRRVLVTAMMATAACAMAVPAAAQTQGGRADQEAHYGVRAGFSGFPNQFFIGGHIDAPQFHFKTGFRPSVELGFGDNTTLLSVNLDLVHWMPFSSTSARTAWSMYAGAGVGANFEMIDEVEDEFFGNLAAVFGFQHTSGVFAELRVGMRPSVKVAAGFVLR